LPQPNADGNGDSNGDSYSYSYCHANGYCYCYSDSDGYCHANSNGDGAAEAYTDAQAASDASASSVVAGLIRTLKGGNSREKLASSPPAVALLSRRRFIFFHALRSRRGDRSTFAH
jgi:hypothetical protein